MPELEHRLPADGSPAIAMELVEALVGDVMARVLDRMRQLPDPRFLSKRALAEYLGVSERRIKTLRARGLPARKIVWPSLFSSGGPYRRSLRLR